MRSSVPTQSRRQVSLLPTNELILFLSKIDIKRNVNACWNWRGAKIPKHEDLFYGTYKSYRLQEQHNAHIWAYRNFVGPLNLDLELAHFCLNGLCCNWMTHLVETDHSTNQYMTMDPRFGPGKFCNNGHERTKENTFTVSRGERGCKLCRRDSLHAWRARIKEVTP